MAKAPDLAGKKFGRWRVLKRAGSDSLGQALWLCKCKCGKLRRIRAGNLRSGATQSCGCLRDAATVKRSTKHGHARRGKHSPEYDVWMSMKERCSNPKNKSWEHYGAKGVKVAKRWLSFKNFYADLGRRPPGTSLGRKNDKGDYSRGNAAWQTLKQQGANRANRTRLRVAGVTRSVAEWAAITGQKPSTIHGRIARGWSPLEALIGRIAAA